MDDIVVDTSTMSSTISIDQIMSNPDLDISARVQDFAQSGKWTEEDCKELAVASIKREYEYLASTRTNISPKTDEYLRIVAKGGKLTGPQLFEMVCDDPQKVETYAKYDYLNTKISKNNGITQEDYNNLAAQIGIDSNSANELYNELIAQGKIIDSYTR